MKFELKTLAHYSDEKLIEELKRVANLVDKETLSVKEFDKHSKVHSSTIRKRFGGWKNALAKAKLNKRIDFSNEQVSKKELLTEIKKVHTIIGKPFTRKEFEQHSKYSSSLIYKHFQKFSTALENAGIEPLKKSLRYNDEERFENLLNVWTYYRRQPSYQEMKKKPSVIGPKSYVTRWKTWRDALTAFVDKVNKDNEPDFKENEEELKTNQEINQKVKRNRTPKSEQREIRLGMRYDILKRDNFKCVICGNSPASDPTCKLQVDHILAWANGGKTTKDNLRTLCSDCNNGKSDKE